MLNSVYFRVQLRYFIHSHGNSGVDDSEYGVVSPDSVGFTPYARSRYGVALPDSVGFTPYNACVAILP